MVVGGKGSLYLRPGPPVVPDGGGEGKETGSDAGVDAGQDSAAVLLEGELALEGVEDRLGPLPLAGEPPEPRGLVLAVGAD